MEAFFLCNKSNQTDSSKLNGQQSINGSKKVHKQKPKKERTAVANKRHAKTETKTKRIEKKQLQYEKTVNQTTEIF